MSGVLNSRGRVLVLQVRFGLLGVRVKAGLEFDGLRPVQQQRLGLADQRSGQTLLLALCDELAEVVGSRDLLNLVTRGDSKKNNSCRPSIVTF